jgi:Fanconi-associated nuclease 1
MPQSTEASVGQSGGAPARALPPDYYLKNFEHVLDHVLARSAVLFSPAEVARFEEFRRLTAETRRLYVRLYLRSAPLFRVSKLAYPEVGDLACCVADLSRGGWATVLAEPASPEEAAGPLDALTAGELRELTRRLGLPGSGRKADLVERLAVDPRAWPEVARADQFVALGERPLFGLVQLLFFGNRRQDLSEFVLEDLERARYPRYVESWEPPLFDDRAALDEYVAAVAEWEEGLAVDDPAVLCDAARRALERAETAARPAPHQWRLFPGRYRERLAFAAARELERLGELGAAAEIYERLALRGVDIGTRASAAERLGILARKANLGESFLAVSEALLAAPELDATARYAIVRRRTLLGADCGEEARPLSARVVELALEPAGHLGTKALYRGVRGPATVEEAVLEALGGDGLFAENALYRTLFGLLLWDVVYADVPGMFRHRFQSAPLDADTEYFFANRRDLIVGRLEALRPADLGEEVALAWAAHRGEMSRFVHWDGFTPELLARCARSLGEPLLGVLERLARNPKRHGRGMPDLLVWQDGRAVLVEVKGPGDQLSIEQRLWHDALLRLGLDVCVAKVRRTVAPDA